MFFNRSRVLLDRRVGGATPVPFLRLLVTMVLAVSRVERPRTGEGSGPGSGILHPSTSKS